MRVYKLVCAAVIAASLPAVALADDPRDPEMQNVTARERDREGVRDLNRQELDRVRERDARYAKGWQSSQAGGSYGASNADYAARLRDYERAKAQYDRDMAEWRRAVAACRAGDRSACD